MVSGLGTWNSLFPLLFSSTLTLTLISLQPIHFVVSGDKKKAQMIWDKKFAPGVSSSPMKGGSDTELAKHSKHVSIYSLLS